MEGSHVLQEPKLNSIRLFSILASLIGAFGTLAWITASLLPNPARGFATDWSYFLPYLLAGEQWVRVNGWFSPAYFTPAFCGGVPFLANPQSMLWSLPQVLFMAVGPLAAPWWTLLLCAIGGGGGTWLLARRCFGVSAELATLACVFFILNGFLTFRLVVGHLAYWTFALIPWIASLALRPCEGGVSWRNVASYRPSLAGAALLALMVFGGALGFVVPSLLAVATLILLQQTRSGLLAAPWRRLGAMCLLSVPMTAIKLVPAGLLAIHHGRDLLMFSTFRDSLQLLVIIVDGFFWPAGLPLIVSPGPGQQAFFLYEFEYGVSVVPLIVLATWTLQRTMERRWRLHRTPLLLLVLVLAIPLAGTTGGHTWGMFLQRIPIINNNTTLVRWWIIYLLPLVVLSAVALDAMCRSAGARIVALAACSLVAMVQFAARDLAPYRLPTSAPFDATSVANAHDALARGENLPGVTALGGWPAVPDAAGVGYAPPASLVDGVSTLPCYEPLFGYRLEQFPAISLQAGPVQTAEGPFLNLADPRCYLDAGPASCRPGDRFARDDPAVAAFVNYRPLPWQEPLWQRAAAWSSALSLSAAAAVLLFGRFVRCRGDRRGGVRS